MFPLEPTLPVDRCTISTTVRISPDLLKSPKRFATRRDIPLRGYKSIKFPGMKFGQSRPALILHLLKFGGAQVTILPIGRSCMSDILLNFNPGVIIYGHNGRILRETEFCHAMYYLTNTLSQLLDDQEDWWRLVPSSRPDSPAYWSYVEIPLHCHDPNGQVLKSFRNARHPSIRKQARHWETSMLLPGGNFQLSVYRKAVEMASRGKLSEEELQRFEDVLRIEVRLRKEQLVKHLGSPENKCIIDGVERIVRFNGSDLVNVLRVVFDGVQGVFRAAGPILPAKGQIEPLGRLIAWASGTPEAPQTFHEILSAMSAHFGTPGDTRRQHRKAGLASISAMSALVPADLLSEAAIATQPHVISEKLEKLTHHDLPYGTILDAIHRAYATPQQKFHPHTELPTYY